MPVAAGTRLDSYEIVALLGAGGMGEVYRARDAVLKRDVAIKVLPEYSRDAARLRRFELEAQAAAALNHPNIVSIFHVGRYDGSPYIVTELLDGGTLREELRRGPMPVRKSIDYSVQIARGLAAAHDRGVVHRDLKPENLFITKDGRAKILDFGLAKLTQRHWAAGDSSLPTATKGTESGAVMGTVGYMAPEQVSGEPVDHRVDIFALGAIMYEALTGKRAFQKPTAAETMSAILNEDPPSASRHAPTIPPALQKVVHRCLEKNPAQRFQSASDLAFALEALSDSGVQSVTVLAQPKKLSWTWYAAIGAGVVVAAVLVFLQLRPKSLVVPATDWVQITNFSDSVTSPAFSADGRMLTFLRGNDPFVAAGQVYVMLLPHGNPVRLTNDPSPKMSPVFSPDGANVSYTVPWDTWTVPVLGGQPRLWLPNTSGLTWVDTDSLMFSQITSGNHMELVSSDLSRSHARTIFSPASYLGMVHRSYTSPDHKWVIVVEMTGAFWERCRLIPFDSSGRSSPIGPADGVCTAAAWSPDGTWMYLNTNSDHAFHIWRQRFPNGEIEQVTSGPTEEEGIAVDPDGKSLVTAVGIHRSSVWLHDSHGDRLLTSEATAGLAEAYNGGPFSPDTKKLYYLVRRTPGREYVSARAVGELWELDLQSGATQAILPGISIFQFSLSSDGREIAFTVLGDDGSRRSIWVAPLDRSSSPRMLQTDADDPRFASGYIYYVKRTVASAHVHRVRSDGSGDEQIWDEKIQRLATSPDGRYLAVTVPLKEGVGMGREQWDLKVVDWARNRVQRVCSGCVGYWSDDGRSFLASGGYGVINKGAPTYVISLSQGGEFPVLPTKGLSDIKQFAELEHARSIPETSVGVGRTPDIYAFVKETVQRNLYRIPLH